MDWILLSLASAGMFGVLTAFDKRLIDKHLPSLGSFYAIVAISLVFSGLVGLGAAGGLESAPAGRLLAAGLSGFCWATALAFMSWGYKLEEASRVTAIVHVFPVFVALMAVGFLGESLAIGQWLAIATVVAGAMLVSLRGSARHGFTRLTRAFPVLIGASLFFALAHLTGKYALAEVSVWLVYALRNFTMAILLFFLARPKAFRQIVGAMRDRKTLAMVVAAEFVLAPIAALSVTVATSLGPVSLVAAISATRPFFVFILTTILSMPPVGLLNEPLERNTLALKLVSVALIVAGTGALSLL